MTNLYLPRPTAGDVVELILDDHRLFEDLLRQLRDTTADREAARQALADVLIAHGEAEEQEVYPKLVRKDAIDTDEELQKALTHHIGEEEQTILNPARTEVSEAVRAELGASFAAARNALLD